MRRQQRGQQRAATAAAPAALAVRRPERRRRHLPRGRDGRLEGRLPGRNPDVTVNYDAVGSGGGREQFLAGGVLFAGSDSTMTDDELSQAQDTCSGDAIEFPVYVSPIAVIYNLEGVDDLQLSPDTLTQIFARQDHQVGRPGHRRPTTPTPTCRTPTSRRCTVRTSRVRRRTSPTTCRRSTRPAGPTGRETSGRSRAARPPTAPPASCRPSRAATAPSATPTRARPVSSARPRSRSAASTSGPAPRLPRRSSTSPQPAADASETNIAIDVNRTTERTRASTRSCWCRTTSSAPRYDSQDQVDLVKGFESYVISEDGQNAAADAAGSAPITDSIREQAQAAIDTDRHHLADPTGPWAACTGVRIAHRDLRPEQRGKATDVRHSRGEQGARPKPPRQPW